MQIAQLKSEIRKFVHDEIVAGKKVPAASVVEHILRKHPVVYDKELLGTAKCDGAYAELARYTIARDYTRRVLNEFKRTPESLPLFPGYAHMQLAYSITEKKPLQTAWDDEEEDGELQVTLVPTEQISDEELLARAEQYERMGKGCYDHATEIRHYVKERRARRAKIA